MPDRAPAEWQELAAERAEDRDHWRDHEYVSRHEDDINSAAAVGRYEEWLGAGR